MTFKRFISRLTLFDLDQELDRDQGEITVTLREDGTDGLVLEVSDTGTGISTAYLANLFEPFSQEDPGLTRRFEGAGIGLALAKRFLDLNGAAISAASEKGKGSAFRVHFPKRIMVTNDDDARSSRRKRSSGSAVRLAAAS